MDRKSKLLFFFFAIILCLSVSASYYRFMVLHDYVIEAEVDCDPSVESCFVWECDPAVEDECTGDPEMDVWYYKIAHRNAKNIPECDTEDETCDQFTCPKGGEEECNEVQCSSEALVEHHVDIVCTVPADFAEMPSIEEEVDDINENDGNAIFEDISPTEEVSGVDESTEE